MDILLTHGYFLQYDQAEQTIMKPYPPLGLLYLSSHLKAQGFDVGLHDTTFSSPAELQATIERTRPAAVGVYANMLTRRQVLETLRAARAVGSVAIAGGPDAATYPEEYLKHGADIVVVGEGELTLAELLPHLARRRLEGLDAVAGIVYRAGEAECVRIAPRAFITHLDAQPFPDRAAVDITAYQSAWRGRHGASSISLIASRGCPYSCAWCSHAVFGHTHRRRSPQNVAEEIALIRETYAPELLWFADDVFTMDAGWIHAFRDEIMHRGLRVPFETISREDRLDAGVIHALKDLGCYRLWIGAESGSQRILDAMGRRTDAGRVREVIRLLHREGIEAGLFIMLGYEGEELSDLEATVAHLKTAGADAFLTTLAYPIPGTPYYQRVADRVIRPGPWEETSDRETTVAGGHSRRYYRFASRWMVSAVAGHRLRAAGPRSYPRRARALVSAGIGRLGMRLTAHEVERG